MMNYRLGIVLLVCLHINAEAAENCGQKKSIAQRFIANGYTAMAGAWPWHGAMFHRNERSTAYACGVTILTEQFVITAAHCTFDMEQNQYIPASRVFVKVGVTNLDSPERHGQQHNADRIIRHEGYDDLTFEDDIALVKLYTEIAYSSYVQPICLWEGDTSLSKVLNQVGCIVGWGLDEKHGMPKDLNEATVPIVSKGDCLSSDRDHYTRVYHEPKTFCAGYRNGTAAGPGDSGGGMFLRIGDNWFLRGIVSNGKTDPNTLIMDSASFVVFTDVAYYLDWIREHLMIIISLRFNTEIEAIPPPTNTSIAEEAIPPPTNTSIAEAPSALLNLLSIESCGKDSYPTGTAEELKRLLNQYPWLVVIEYINLYTRFLEDVCHGVLIHPSFALTAAHCVQRKRRSALHSVRLNDYRLDTVVDIFEIDGKQVNTSADRIAISEATTNPNYNNPKFTNNIAILKLAKPTTMTPICLPSKGFTLPTDKLFNIVGWKKHPHKEKPMIRNVVQLKDFENCRKQYAALNITLDSSGGQLCSTYSHDDGDDKCSHYMGSAPFQIVMNGPTVGRYYLGAISSFGYADCRRDDFSDVFTNVAQFADWIGEKVKN